MKTIQRFVREDSGASALEFALVVIPFVMTMLFVIVAAFILYLNEALDFATSKAARLIMTGSAQTSSMSASSFQQKLCSFLPPMFQCANLSVSLYSVPPAIYPGGYSPFVNANQSALILPALGSGGGAQFQMGTPGTYEYLLVQYPITFLPSAFASILSGGATFNGVPAYVAVSTAAFLNEQYQ